MKFRYRFVPYGTQFVAAAGLRQNAPKPAPKGATEMEKKEAAEDVRRLHENELACDVGGECLAPDSGRAVVDHHFFRDDGRQYPSAAAAVLHRAADIAPRFRGRFESVWLVTHRAPDFDAYSSMFLARCLLEEADFPADGWEDFGLKKNGWKGEHGEINWFNPVVGHMPIERRWPILLAANAAVIDQCRRIECPRERALHSILGAAEVRGRGYDDETSGAFELFDEIRTALGRKLNPLYDSVLEGSEEFLPELRLLDRESTAYRRDLTRAHRSIVHLKKATTDFEIWFEKLKQTPLFDAEGKPNREHRDLPGQVHEQADAIFLRDPESILFKEWARNDTENSSMHRGFLFTAVAYSKGRPNSSVNDTEYYFAIDPERSNGKHLYDVWTRLQQAEIAALHAPENTSLRTTLEAEKRPPRPGFEERAQGKNVWFFFDPWFDGNNFKCTIVPTPNQGTLLRPGVAADLRDDEVVKIVRDQLEGRIFIADGSPLTPTLGEAKEQAPYRFEARRLDPGVRILDGDMAGQIARSLWDAIHGHSQDHVPPDFEREHILKTNEWVGVWSRRGIAIAYKTEATEKIASVRALFDRLVTLAKRVETLPGLLQAASQKAKELVGLTRRERRKRIEHAGPPFRDVQDFGEKQLEEMVDLRRALADPDHRLANRFFEASRIEEVLRSSRELYSAAVEQEQARALQESARETSELQSKLEWIEIFVLGVYAVEIAGKLGEVLHFGRSFLGASLVCCAVVVPIVAFWLLRPDQHEGLNRKRLAWSIGVLAAAFALFLFLGIGVVPREPPNEHGSSATKIVDKKDH